MRNSSTTQSTDKLVEFLNAINTDDFLTVSEIAERIGVSPRMIYNYFTTINGDCFIIEKKGSRYRLDRRSPFLERITASIPLTSAEAEFVCRMLASVDDGSNLAQSVKRKLVRYYHLSETGTLNTDKPSLRKMAALNEAISKKRVVILKNYSSPNSHTLKDRVVEPYYIFNNGQDVRCFELASGLNKTFKIARMEAVTVQSEKWTHERSHRKVYTDIFAFSGENAYIVELILGQLSYNLLIEEYPQARRFVQDNGDGRWRVILNVMSYLGVGRFVLGLYDDIEVIGDEGFKAYLRDKIASMR